MKKLIVNIIFLNIIFGQLVVTGQSNNIYSDSKQSIKKKIKLNKDQKKNWQHLDFEQDTILGASIDKAYLYASKNLQLKDTIVVAVIDSDPDLNHEDLQGQLWVNPKEIPNNNIDDDDNGYIDDIHGWNFTSSAKGKSMIFSLMEETRIIQKYKDQFSTTPLKINNKDSASYKRYIVAKASYNKNLDEINKEIEKLKLKNFTDPSIAAKIDRHFKSIEICLNLEKDNRIDIVKDNPDDLTDTKYGSPKFSSGIDHLTHSTSVSSVLAGNRINTIGIKGIAQNSKVMFLNIGTFGDYTDKDLALAIRYAVDNGACIINISRSKKFSIHEDWVDDALKYAEKNNVLIVMSAGNLNLDLDLDIYKNTRYPNDVDEQGKEFINNFITVGGNNYHADKKIKHHSSNYGKTSVDVFAPGRSIKVAKPYNKYATKSGTSYSAPIVSGIAAMILSYFPELSAVQLKEILLTSGISFDIDATIKDSKETIPFSELSKSGKIVNAYNALLMAEQVSKE